jgi:tRNA threonylcarbamoyladenosine biosynthesis protein TsaE
VSWSLRTATSSPTETRAVAGALAALSRPGDLVILAGGLGAGKTVFAQGFAATLGVAGPVTSPTFTLVRQYRCAGREGIAQLVHADLYRLDHLAEVADLALAELLEDGGVGLVEWGDVAAPVLGPSVLEVLLSRPPEAREDERALTVSGRGPAWAGRRDEVAAALAPFGVAEAVGRP